MAVTLRALQTVVPPTVLVQEQVRDIFAAQPGLSRLAQRLVTASFNLSGIDTRHTVIEELTLDSQAPEPQFFDATTQRLLVPGTRVRNELYIEQATKLFVEAGRRALAACPGLDASDITHVVTVSCTGFYAPGPDYMLVRELGLAPSTQRYHLGFMGCYAAMPALRTAKQFVLADPSAVVLVVSAELCSLHLRTSNDPDTIVASSLFSDGAAAGIVSSRAPVAGETALNLDHFETVITPVGEGDMAWKIGDEGFEMVLSSYVPHIIDEHIESALAPLFGRDESLTLALAAGVVAEADAVTVQAQEQQSQSVDGGGRPGQVLTAATPGSALSTAIAHWAIHPGGRSILDKTEAKLGLTEAQLVPSRETLRTNGNMSSATILFVMKEILEGAATADGDRVCAMAFGPGLTVESGLMTVQRG
ncbi:MULTISPECIES: type III polyketide synthase [unclassified Cryobacterium]|uniref:type III polyketide synthase n=1 Tax=unclassified Cryobacterium TaxID=2649013 RepID=UPI00106C5490|nr:MULTISPECIES: type III polyketide synthase [unclassified Cryobacterium]TFC50277.1 type III polyketide synthase [Cryobacterium sp. TMB3-1-2]TFC71989.1 type III polyketide synthase [Cryobacterium sp. TMB3-15]TFC78582.1 type III polyketide synthase [Cryobacterium sp. TMB3-10]TFD39269.1 type III polyketide synthase [Cryobacterium sp. TMB3-12]